MDPEDAKHILQHHPDEHVFMWETPNLNTDEGGWIEFPGGNRFRATCRCGWTSRRNTSVSVQRARDVWERDHWNEICFHKAHEQEVGISYHDQFTALQEKYQALKTEDRHYDQNPFGE